MKKLIPLLGSGALAVLLGASNQFVLLGTKSPQMLILVGALLLILGYASLFRFEINPTTAPTQKNRLWWRVALVAACGVFTLLGLVLIIGFSVATLLRGETVHGDMITATVMGCIMGLPFVPAVYLLKKAQSENTMLNVCTNRRGK